MISSLWLDLKSINVLYSKESSFFNRWASSTPRKAQLMLPKTVCRKRREKAQGLRRGWVRQAGSPAVSAVQSVLSQPCAFLLKKSGDQDAFPERKTENQPCCPTLLLYLNSPEASTPLLILLCFPTLYSPLSPCPWGPG